MRELRDLVVRARRGGEPDPVVGAIVAAGVTLASLLILLVIGGGLLMGLTLLPGPGLGQVVVPSLSPFLAGCVLLAPAAGAAAGSWWAWDEMVGDRPGQPRSDLVTGMWGAAAGGLVLATVAAAAAHSELTTPPLWIAAGVALVAGCGAGLPWLGHRVPALRGPVVAGAAYLLASMLLDFIARTLLVPGLSAGQAGSVMRAARHAAHLAPWVGPIVALLASAAGGWWGVRPRQHRDHRPDRWALAGLGPFVMSLFLLAAGCLVFGPGSVLHGRWPSLTDAAAVLAGGLCGARLIAPLVAPLPEQVVSR